MTRLPGSSEAVFWRRVLEAVKALIEEALREAGVSVTDVQWSEMRWDARDVTASWPKESPSRNVHGWMTGAWPRFTLDLEGAAWKDVEPDLQRHVMFFAFPEPAAGARLILVSGSTAEPHIAIPNREDLLKRLIRLARDVQAANPAGNGDGRGITSQLQPRPGRNRGQEGREGSSS